MFLGNVKSSRWYVIVKNGQFFPPRSNFTLIYVYSSASFWISITVFSSGNTWSEDTHPRVGAFQDIILRHYYAYENMREAINNGASCPCARDNTPDEVSMTYTK